MKHETSIYIVEDELLIAANLKDQLMRAGFVFLGMSTRGEEALKEILLLKEQHKSPEIVLMDVCLRGEKDGIETAGLLCEITDCAIIFLTGQSSREIYERSFHVKPYGYVLKPYDLEQTIMTIEIAAYQRKLAIENREMRIRLETLLDTNEYQK
ncbi:MAG: response regulator [Bacteroidales bacterium]|nr:response regulator [Bacteroidales bacterium]